MRLGIRRKLIGTLVLVGLLPLIVALAVILLGGARLRLREIQKHYRFVATEFAVAVAQRFDQRLYDLTFIARLPEVVRYARDRDRLFDHQLRTGKNPMARAAAVQKQWKLLPDTADPVRTILHNPLSQTLRLVSMNHPRYYRLFASDRRGRVIAADVKPSRYLVADSSWWRDAYAGGRGRPAVGTFARTTAGRQVVNLAAPIIDPRTHRVLGVIRESISTEVLSTDLARMVAQLNAAGQVVDLAARKTQVAVGDPKRVRHALQRFWHQGTGRVSWFRSLFSGPIIGSSTVPFAAYLAHSLPAAATPRWAAVISRRNSSAMGDIYSVATTVAVIGVVLIVLLFVVGVAITNRQVIAPVLRLRAATAAVARGELNVRLAPEAADGTGGSGDELDELAHDFDNMTRQLQYTMNQMARANEAKKRFMELAGHELRTPVTYILGVCELALRQLQQPAEGRGASPGAVAPSPRALTAALGALQKIAGKTGRLNRIIDNLLKLVNNDQFTTRIQKAPLDIRELILHVCNENRPFLAERHQHLTLDIPESLPPFEGDRDKLEDVLTNLLSNAIRFSPDHATLRVAAREVVGDMLEILVQDAGPGIPQADIDHLFEPFYTGTDILHHHSGTIEFGSKGIGLGLAIVRRFVELHGGVVRVHSSDAGTQFQILLPLSGCDGNGDTLPPGDEPRPAPVDMPAPLP